MLEHEDLYRRLASNLQRLEERNPDLSILLNLLDGWLDRYISTVASDAADASKVSEPEVKETPAAEAEISKPSPVAPQAKKPVERPKPDSPVLSVEAALSSLTLGAAKAGAVASENVVNLVEGSDASSSSTPLAPQTNVFNPVEIEQLEKRLLLKIEASRWALERDKMLKANVDFQSQIEPRDHALLARARELTNCYLWMNNPETAPVVATDTYELLADAYAATARCVSFLRKLTDRVDKSPRNEPLSRILRDALYITATAQSALRRVTYEVSGREDQDQIRIHRWLTLLTKKYSIYVNRHMKKNSLAPVEKIYLIPDYIKKLEEQLDKLGQKQKILSDGFGRIQYHAARITAEKSDDYDWNRIMNTIDDLIDAGIRVTDPRFSEQLFKILPFLKAVPSCSEHPGFISVLLDMDYWKDPLERERIQQELAQVPPRTPSAEDAEDDGLAALWNDEEEEGAAPKPAAAEGESAVPAAAPEEAPAPAAVELPEPTEEEKHSFGFGILPRTPAAEALNAQQRAPFRPLPQRPGIQPVPSYAGVVSEQARLHPNDAKQTEEMLSETTKSIGDRVLILVDGTDDASLQPSLAEGLKVQVLFAGSEVIQSETALSQLTSPEGVAVVLMIDDTVPTSNRTVENYCRSYDKPLLRIVHGASVASIARQIQAALSLYN